jgi:sporulation protein YlmC with PRC-barrel domain
MSGLMASSAWAQSAAQSTDAGNSPKFVASQNPDQWVFSKFKGSEVVGPNDESIGSVNDLLFDKSGKIVGVMVGVGGFLGIGQKNVAIDMSGFQAMPAKSAGASTAPVTGTAPATSRSEDPTNVKLKVAWTKEQIQQAPDFKYYAPPSEISGAPPATTGVGGGQRPSPMSPLSPPTAPRAQ